MQSEIKSAEHQFMCWKIAKSECSLHDNELRTSYFLKQVHHVWTSHLTREMQIIYFKIWCKKSSLLYAKEKIVAPEHSPSDVLVFHRNLFTKCGGKLERRVAATNHNHPQLLTFVCDSFVETIYFFIWSVQSKLSFIFQPKRSETFLTVFRPFRLLSPLKRENEKNAGEKPHRLLLIYEKLTSKQARKFGANAWKHYTWQKTFREY